MSRYTAKFAVLQSFYWIAACFVYAFAERFLSAYGFAVQRIGFLTAGANAVALLLQPPLADLADRPRGLSLKGEICGLCAIAALAALLLLFWDAPLILAAILFVSLATATLTVQPMVNAVGFRYVDAGKPIDYALGRGIASAVFAVFCYAMGFLADWRIESLLWTYLLAGAGLFVSALLFTPPERSLPNTAQTVGTAALLRKHPFLSFFLPGMILMFAAHNFINAYMLSIVREIGCGTHEMSAAIALAAIVEIPAMAGFSRLIRRFQLESLLCFSAGAFFVKQMILLLPLFLHAGVWAVYLSQAFQMFGYAIYIPAASFLLNGRMDETDKVKGQMLLTEAQTLGCILGQLVGGYGIARLGVPFTMLCYCAVSAVGAALIVRAIRRFPASDSSAIAR